MNQKYTQKDKNEIGGVGFSLFYALKKYNKPVIAKSAFINGEIHWSELGFKSLGTLIGPIVSPLVLLHKTIVSGEPNIKERIGFFILTVLLIASIPVHYLLNIADLIGSLLMTLKDAFQEKFCSSSLRYE